MTADESIQKAAARLAADRRNGTPFAGFEQALRPDDEAAAYDIQAALNGMLAGREGVRVGWKIGCTTPVMQEFLGIASPCAGHIRAAGVYQRAATLTAADYLRAGVECEIAVRLASNLPAASRPYSRDQVAAAVGSCMAAMEIVDDRYVDYGMLDAPTLIADDFFHAGCILDRPASGVKPADLAALAGRMRIDGEVVGAGRGAEILGDPMAALEWLANSVASGDGGLRAGEIVMLGSLVRTEWPRAGAWVSVEIDGLGGVEAQFV